MNRKQIAIKVSKHPLVKKLLESKLATPRDIARLVVEELLSENVDKQDVEIFKELIHDPQKLIDNKKFALDPFKQTLDKFKKQPPLMRKWKITQEYIEYADNLVSEIDAGNSNPAEIAGIYDAKAYIKDVKEQIDQAFRSLNANDVFHWEELFNNYYWDKFVKQKIKSGITANTMQEIEESMGKINFYIGAGLGNWEKTGEISKQFKSILAELPKNPQIDLIKRTLMAKSGENIEAELLVQLRSILTTERAKKKLSEGELKDKLHKEIKEFLGITEVELDEQKMIKLMNLFEIPQYRAIVARKRLDDPDWFANKIEEILDGATTEEPVGTTDTADTGETDDTDDTDGTTDSDESEDTDTEEDEEDEEEEEEEEEPTTEPTKPEDEVKIEPTNFEKFKEAANNFTNTFYKQRFKKDQGELVLNLIAALENISSTQDLEGAFVEVPEKAEALEEAKEEIEIDKEELSDIKLAFRTLIRNIDTVSDIDTESKDGVLKKFQLAAEEGKIITPILKRKLIELIERIQNSIPVLVRSLENIKPPKLEEAPTAEEEISEKARQATEIQKAFKNLTPMLKNIIKSGGEKDLAVGEVANAIEQLRKISPYFPNVNPFGIEKPDFKGLASSFEKAVQEVRPSLRRILDMQKTSEVVKAVIPSIIVNLKAFSESIFNIFNVKSKYEELNEPEAESVESKEEEEDTPEEKEFKIDNLLDLLEKNKNIYEQALEYIEAEEGNLSEDRRFANLQILDRELSLQGSELEFMMNLDSEMKKDEEIKKTILAAAKKFVKLYDNIRVVYNTLKDKELNIASQSKIDNVFKAVDKEIDMLQNQLRSGLKYVQKKGAKIPRKLRIDRANFAIAEIDPEEKKIAEEQLQKFYEEFKNAYYSLNKDRILPKPKKLQESIHIIKAKLEKTLEKGLQIKATKAFDDALDALDKKVSDMPTNTEEEKNQKKEASKAYKILLGYFSRKDIWFFVYEELIGIINSIEAFIKKRNTLEEQITNKLKPLVREIIRRTK